MSNIILIPTYNESNNIAGIIADIRKYEKDIKIMVIDDNSPDNTAGIVKGLMETDQNISLLERKDKQGLGKAYIDALERVKKIDDIENIITMDADGSHDPKYIPEMLRLVYSYDLVIGSRYVKGGGVDNWEWYRRALSGWGNIYSRLILGIGIKDLTAGFVCFKKRLLGSLDLASFQSSGYAYQIEFKYKCLKYDKASYVEIPIIFHERKVGHSKLSLSIIIGGLLTPIKLRFLRY